MSESKFEDWITNNIDARDQEIVKEIQETLLEWINEYKDKDNTQNQPTEEELKQIEEFRRKGFI